MSTDVVAPALTGRLTELELADETRRLLESVPDAVISAVSDAGFWIPMPPTMPLSRQTVAHGYSSALELVVPDDLHLVISAWQDAYARGTAQVEVRPLGAKDSTMTLHYVDARAAHGVFLCFLDGDVVLAPGQVGNVGAMRPRVTTVRKNDQAVFTAVDDAATQILGHTDLVGRRNVDLVHPADAPRAIANWMDLLSSPGESRRVRLRLRHRDGHWLWFEITNHNLLNDPAERCVVAEMVDISEEMAAYEVLRTQEDLLRRLTDSLPVGVVQVDTHGSIVHRNARLTEIIGHPGAMTLDELFTAVIDEDQKRFADAVGDALDDINRDIEVGIRHPGGMMMRCHLIMRPLTGNGAIVCVDDVTDSARLRDDLHYRATYDPLTGCRNRASVLLEIERALSDGAEATNGVAVAFIDLDGFKQTNDRYGHAAGDALLKNIGECLQRAGRSGDIVGRLGGDEFIALGTGIDTPVHAYAMGSRLADALAGTFKPGPNHRAVASIGVAWAPPDTKHMISAETLIGRADIAMYRSKAEGIGRTVIAQLD